MEKAPRPCAHMHPAFLPPSSQYGALKSLLESPMKLPLHQEGLVMPQEKQKCVEDEDRSAPQSAFLGPTLWDFQLEYMDLDEFLYENGIATSPAHRHDQPILAQNACANNHHERPILNQSPPQAPPAPSHRQPSIMPPSPPSAAQRQPSIMSQAPPTVMDLSHASTSSCLHRSAPPSGPNPRNTPSPVDPDSIQVPVGFDPDPADLALSSVPGQEAFDPRKRRFSTEELKPQPMIKKARKVYTPEDLKDDRYWARRRKNNMAAKRSRDARRLKENQIAVRAAFLEKENSALRQEVSTLRQEMGRTKSLLSRYQAQHGPL